MSDTPPSQGARPARTLHDDLDGQPISVPPGEPIDPRALARQLAAQARAKADQATRASAAPAAEDPRAMAQRLVAEAKARAAASAPAEDPRAMAQRLAAEAKARAAASAPAEDPRAMAQRLAAEAKARAAAARPAPAPVPTKSVAERARRPMTAKEALAAAIAAEAAEAAAPAPPAAPAPVVAPPAPAPAPAPAPVVAAPTPAAPAPASAAPSGDLSAWIEAIAPGAQLTYSAPLRDASRLIAACEPLRAQAQASGDLGRYAALAGMESAVAHARQPVAAELLRHGQRWFLLFDAALQQPLTAVDERPGASLNGVMQALYAAR